jgi:hypothetical protein
MRLLCAVSVVAALVAVLATTPGGAAEPPARAAATTRLNCANSTGGFGRREVRFGPAWVRAVRQYADPALFASRRQADSGLYWAKAPLSLRRGRTATVSIAPKDRPFVDFGFGGRNVGDVVRVTACPRNRHRDTGERRFTSWAGGYYLTQRRCIDVVAHPRRSGSVDRATLSFGMGDACSQP